jgi:hypothetical protein
LQAEAPIATVVAHAPPSQNAVSFRSNNRCTGTALRGPTERNIRNE